MEAMFLKPLPVELFFNIMSPYSPQSLHQNKSEQAELYLTSTLIGELLSNVTQSLDNDDYSNSSLVRYKTFYRNYHGIVSSFVCIFGLTCNLFNIIVLTRPLMRSSTNTILTSLALSDLIKMLLFLPAAILFYCLQTGDRKSEPDFTSRFQVTFYMLQMLLTLTLHCISTWLTVLLAGFRYVFLSCKSLTPYVSTPDRALVGVCLVVLISTILSVPSYIEHRIDEVITNETDERTNTTILAKSYRFAQTELSTRLSLRETVFVLNGVIFKLIPCVLLLLFSFLLVQQLRFALQNAEKLQKHSLPLNASGSNGRSRGRRREMENRRTTMMLVIVCALFLLTELPQGAILLLSFISKSNSKYYYRIYQLLGDTFDILALINNSVNFILYCLMSRAFRDTFKQTFGFGCHKSVRRESTMSFAQLSLIRNRPTHLSPSVGRTSNDHRPSLTPSESNADKKNPSSLTVNNSPTTPLLSGSKPSSSRTKKTCFSS